MWKLLFRYVFRFFASFSFWKFSREFLRNSTKNFFEDISLIILPGIPSGDYPGRDIRNSIINPSLGSFWNWFMDCFTFLEKPPRILFRRCSTDSLWKFVENIRRSSRNSSNKEFPMKVSVDFFRNSSKVCSRNSYEKSSRKSCRDSFKHVLEIVPESLEFSKNSLRISYKNLQVSQRSRQNFFQGFPKTKMFWNSFRNCLWHEFVQGFH